MQIFNKCDGPRGVNTTTGPVLIDPGQSADVELSEAELKIAKATGWFKIGGKAEEPAEQKKG